MTQKAILYLGADIQGRAIVSDAQFSTFCRDVVCPKFPGFTLQHATGFWEGKPEPVRLLTIVNVNLGRWAFSAAEFKTVVETIASRYCDRFEQSSVLVETSDVGATLVEV